MSTFQKFQIELSGELKNVIVVNYKPEKKVEQYEAIHHIHILDRSGSMYYEINTLIDNVEETLEKSDENDIHSVGWFSSPEEYSIPIRLAKKSSVLKPLLDSLRSTLSTTCFSNILKEINKFVKETNCIDIPVNITLFTDGQPVTMWSDNEEKLRIFVEITILKSLLMGKLAAINTIGYGNYYNKELLVDIASMTSYGTFVHSHNIQQYFNIFRDNHEKIRENVYQPVQIISDFNDIIYLNRKFTKMKSTKMELDTIDREKNQFFIIVNDNDGFLLNTESYKLKDISTISQDSTINNFLYAYAYHMYYAGKYKKSLDILSNNIKDKALIDSHLKAFTFDERSEHVKRLKYALFNNKDGRYLTGKVDDGYIPDDDGVCVMDVIKKLKEYDAIWIPFHKELEDYKRISVKREDYFDLFEKSDEEIRGKFSETVFNKELLNMSLRVMINGHVKLNPKQAKKVGLEPVFPCCIYRNYTLIKDGNLNMKKIMCLIKHDFLTDFASYINYGIEIIGTVKIDDVLYDRVIIEMERFPIINYTYAKDSENIENVFNTVNEILEKECQQKIVNSYLKNFAGISYLAKEGVFKEFTVAQIELLKEHGIDRNGIYGGIGGGEEKKTGDAYKTRYLNFYIAGVSSLPSLKEIDERLKRGKNLTVSMEILNNEHEKFKAITENDNVNLNKAKKHVKEWLEGYLKLIKEELYRARDYMAILKMAIVLTGNWFDLQSDDKGNYFFEKDGRKMICKTDYKVIEI